MRTSISTLMLTLGLLANSACSTLKPHVAHHPAPIHHRFWQGYIKSGLKKAAFETHINQDFFSLFPAAVPYGLIAYHPVLPVQSHPTDPAEWALVTYKNQDQYNRFKQSEPGKVVAEAHWKLFEKSISGTTVTEPYQGQALANHAYEVNPDYDDYVEAKVVFALYQLPLGQRREEELAENISHNHGASLQMLRNIVFLVTKEYLAEYLFFKSDADLSSFLPSLNADQIITLKPGAPGRDWIHEGQGLKAVF